MNSFNLTESQKDLLRLLVEKVRSGVAREPLLAIGMPDGYLLDPVQGGDSFPIEGWGLGDLDALVDEDLVSMRVGSKGSGLYSVKQAGYDAVDSDFSAPDSSFVTHLTPLADISNLDEELNARCLPILGAGSADPRLWDSAVRTAGVIVEERLRDIGGIVDSSRVGRDLVNDVFGSAGSLSGSFPTDS